MTQMTYDRDGERARIWVVLLTMFPAEYRTWRGEIRSSHLLPDVAQLAHASDAHGSERGSQ